jgi:hypothetical protein
VTLNDGFKNCNLSTTSVMNGAINTAGNMVAGKITGNSNITNNIEKTVHSGVANLGNNLTTTQTENLIDLLKK